MRKNILALFVLFIAGISLCGTAYAQDVDSAAASSGNVYLSTRLGDLHDMMPGSNEMSSDALGRVTGMGMPKQAGTKPISNIILWDEVDPKKAASNAVSTGRSVIVNQTSGQGSGQTR